MNRFLQLILLLGALSAATAEVAFYNDFEAGRRNTVDGVIPADAVLRRCGPDDGSTLVRQTPEALAARSRQSLELSGGFLLIPDTALPRMTETFSINFFFRPAAGNGEAVQTLLCRPGSWILDYRPQSRQLRFSPGSKTGVAIFQLPPDFSDIWQMITLNVETNQIELFIDGQSAGVKKIVGPLAQSRNLYLGAASTQAGKAAHGNFDDLSIWNQTLNREQMTKLRQGAHPQMLDRRDAVRTPTRPYDRNAFAAKQIATTMDARQAVIVPLDRDDGQLARFVQRELEKSWNLKIPIRPVSGRFDGTEHVILAGSGMGNNLMRELAANGQILRTANGPEVHVYPETMDWRRGVIYLGGRNEVEIRESLQLLTAKFPQPEKLAFFTLEKGALNEPPVDPTTVIGEVRKLYNGKFAQQNNLAIKIHLKQLADGFRRTGDETYTAALSEALKIVFENYDSALRSSRDKAPTFEGQLLPGIWYLFESSGDSSADDRYRAAELARKIVEGSMNCWEMTAPAAGYAAGPEKYWTNHYCFAARTVYSLSRYLKSRAAIDGLDYFMAVANYVFRGVAPYPLSPEDAGGYQYLVYRIYTDFMLADGRATPELFRTPQFLELMEYAKSSFNHLGYTAGYGDARLLGMRGPFVPLFEYLEMSGDPEAEAILSLICRHVKTGFHLDACRAWGIAPDLPAPASEHFIGLRTFTVSPPRQELIGIGPFIHPPLDKAIFRTSWQPDAAFLAVNGLSGSPHGHDDAIGLAQYLVGNHLWLYEGDYIRRSFEDHNLISVIRDGRSAERRRNKIPDSERAAQLLGKATSEDRQAAVMTLLLENNNGVDYYRHYGIDAGRGLWVIDELVAREPGDYRFSARWRTTGKVIDTPQGALVRQLADPRRPDDKNIFSISEGTGSIHFRHTDFERGSGDEADGSLAGYPYSDLRTRTLRFWKDAKLDRGERAVFVFYFRPQSEREARPVEIRRLADNVFTVDDSLAVIEPDSRVTFRFPGGIVSTGSGRIPNALERVAGSALPNAVPATVISGASLPAEKILELKAPVSRVAGGKTRGAVGLNDGTLLLLSPNGQIAAETQLPAEITALGSLRWNGREYYLAGCRDTASTAGSGTLFLLDSDGKILWSRPLPPYTKRRGVPRTVFPAYLDGKDAAPSIIVGVEAWHVYAFELDGKERWASTVTHGAICGAAGDLDGDGRDEIYPGVEYYYHTILGPDGKERARTTTSPLVSASLIADAGNGIKLVYAARSDGFLYGEGLSGNRLYQANLGGPAVALAAVKNGIAAANVNGLVTVTDAGGKRRLTVKLPAPASSMLADDNSLLVAALDGKVYRIDSADGTIGSMQSYRCDPNSDVMPQLFRLGDQLLIASGKAIDRISLR